MQFLEEIFSEANIQLKREAEAKKVLENCIQQQGLEDFMSAYIEETGWTAKHSVRAAVIVADIALEKNIYGERLCGLVIGTILHDIGKLDVPNAMEIFGKVNNFTDADKAIVALHSALGLKRLKNDSRLARAATLPGVQEIVIANHALKKIPYPFDLSDLQNLPHDFMGIDVSGWSDDTIELVRIAATADVCDALSHDRPYRKACTSKEEIAKITAETTNLPVVLIDAAVERVLKGLTPVPSLLH